MNEGHSAFLAIERIRVLMAEHASQLRRGAGGLAHQQRLHHAHVRARRASTCSTRPDASVLRRLTASNAGIPLRRSSWPWAAATRTIRRSRSRWPCWPSRRRPTATRSAGCTAAFRRRCGKACGPTCRCGKFPLRPSPTACISPPGSTAISRASTISTCSRTGARATPSRKSGSRSRDIPAQRTVGSASPPQAPHGGVRAGARGRQRASPAMRRRRSRARRQDVLDPEALTIGFARRFATYKRATLMFRDLDAPEEDSVQSDSCPCRS